MKVACQQCLYWEAAPDFPGWGECRRHAPSPYVMKADSNIGPYNSRSVWPYTRVQDGCAEGQSRGKAAAAIAGDQAADPVRTFNEMVIQARRR